MHESGPPAETFVDQLDWHAFEPEELARMPPLPPGTLPLKLEGARWAHLDFYDDHLLIEIRFLNTDGPDRLYGIHSPEGTSWLDGKSTPIHDTNSAESLILSDDTAHEYVRFFIYFVRGDGGPFVLIESPDQIALGEAGADTARQDDLSERLTKARNAVAEVSPSAEQNEFVGGRWKRNVAVAYDGVLFKSTLEIEPDGLVEMTDDDPIVELEGLMFPKYAALELAEESGPPPPDDQFVPANDLAPTVVDRPVDEETNARIEKALRDAITASRWAFATREEQEAFGDSSRQGRVPISADTLRKLIVDDAVATGGIRIRGAAIRGLLDLQEARRQSGDACNALILRDCDFEGAGQESGTPGIDARHSHLRRLSLIDCTVDGVELSDAVIDGDVELDGITGHGIGGPCWVKARGARVGGSITAARAKLALPWKPETPWPVEHPEIGHRQAHSEGVAQDQVAGAAPQSYWSAIRRPFALDLKGAGIAGDLRLQPSFEASGVNIAGATIAGSLVARGATLSAPAVPEDSVEALDAQGVTIHGRAVFDCDPTRPYDPLFGDHQFRSSGTLSFRGATIGGDFSLAGAWIKPRDVGAVALELTDATLSADLWLRRDEREPDGSDGKDVTHCTVRKMRLIDATFSGSIFIDARLEWFIASGIRADGEVQLSGAVKEAFLTDATIGRDLKIHGPEKVPVERVEASGVSVRGTLRLKGAFAGLCDFTGCQVEGDFALGDELEPLCLHRKPWKEPPKIRLAYATVSGSLRVASQINLSSAFAVDASVDLATAEYAEYGLREAEVSCYPGWRMAEATLVHQRAPRLRRPAVSLGSRPLPSQEKVNLAVVSFLYCANDPGDLLLLDGDLSRIYRFNNDHPTAASPHEPSRLERPSRSSRLSLDTESQVRHYLSVLWTNYGEDRWPYVLREPSISPLTPGGRIYPEPSEKEVELSPAQHPWKADCDVEHGLGLFHVAFLVQRSGELTSWVSEPRDADLGQGNREFYWDPPLRWIRHTHSEEEEVDSDSGAEGADGDRAPAPYPPGLDFRPVDKTASTLPKLQETLKEELRRHLDDRRPTIDLTGLKAGSLSDGDGQHWGLDYGADGMESRLQRWPTLRVALDGFEYARFGGDGQESQRDEHDARHLTPEEMVRHRKAWLRAQYLQDPPTEDEYRPQPYQQLASVLRAAGEHDSADAIAFERLELEKVRLRPAPGSSRWRNVRRWSKQRLLWMPFIQWPIGFGLKPFRAVAVFLAFWLVGVGSLYGFSGQLKLDTSSSSLTPAASAAEIPCGNHVNKWIYPLDVMIPFIDLKQESRCRFAYADSGLIILKGLYALVGWGLVTGVLFTLSGVVRRRLER